MDNNPGGSFAGLLNTEDSSFAMTDEWKVLMTTGYALRPRKFEVALAVARLRGGNLAPIPFSKVEIDELIQRKKESDMKAQALSDLWSQRR